jgi:hypothetical protein
MIALALGNEVRAKGACAFKGAGYNYLVTKIGGGTY